MRSYRFLLSRRWAIFAVVVVLLAWAAWWLGQWQFGRLDDRKARNEVIRTNEHRDPAPVDDVLAVGRGAAAADEWRLVTATGSYDVADTVIVRYRSNGEGASGVDVVVPLVADDGTALVVDRGFLETDSRAVDAGDVPAPPPGSVSVTGWVRVDGTGDSADVEDGSTRAISSARIGTAIGRSVYGGFVDLEAETPAPDAGLERTELPELDNGPHFFYGLQWWFFGILALVGFFYFAYDERRHPREIRERASREPRPRQTNVNTAYQRPRKDHRARSMPPSTGSMTPDTNDEAGESRKAAARPNSSGSP